MKIRVRGGPVNREKSQGEAFVGDKRDGFIHEEEGPPTTNGARRVMTRSDKTYVLWAGPNPIRNHEQTRKNVGEVLRVETRRPGASLVDVSSRGFDARADNWW